MTPLVEPVVRKIIRITDNAPVTALFPTRGWAIPFPWRICIEPGFHSLGRQGVELEQEIRAYLLRTLPRVQGQPCIGLRSELCMDGGFLVSINIFEGFRTEPELNQRASQARLPSVIAIHCDARIDDVEAA